MCKSCDAQSAAHKMRNMIPVTWATGDKVSVRGQIGVVGYVYTNGYTLVEFPDTPNNDSTFGNEFIKTLKGGDRN